MTSEHQRLQAAREPGATWRRWGPYLSERQWGTVREDYSDLGNAWEYFSHDQSRSRAYRWGEDGLAGFSDEKQRVCFALALWNGQDPILKERLFGLTNSEGNHGEDVKEYYYYLDATPTHSYQKFLYKYPHAAFPYDDIVRVNRRRTRAEMEYELADTGVFDGQRYFDVFVEYVKAGPEDLLVRITVSNRGSDPAPLHVLPHVWFRNTWSWRDGAPRPSLSLAGASGALRVDHPDLGTRWCYAEGAAPWLFTENESNTERLFSTPNRTPYVKDAFHRYVVGGDRGAVNPAHEGTKAAAHFVLLLPGQATEVVRLRFTETPPDRWAPGAGPFAHFDAACAARIKDADEFYAAITPPSLSEDERMIMRQALAGMLWSKQYYYFDLDTWLAEHGAHPLTGGQRNVRNRTWFHMLNDDVISMPDKWEYPWYAAWDLAFHTAALAMVDIDFAKRQLNLMLREVYLHPNGQLPAYEWNFSDVNPPVHAWATLYVYHLEATQRGEGDIEFLKQAFQKLLINFTWWVNRKDPTGRNVFEGGFLGLDNIGVFDRSASLPTGGHLEQADGTAWMALFSQNMLDISLELARHDATYEDMALKFVQHFLYIAAAMDRIGDHHDEMWDEEDGFYYDLLRLPDGQGVRLKVRSMVGLLPLAATSVVSHDSVERFPNLVERVGAFVRRNPELSANISRLGDAGVNGRRLLSVLTREKLARVLSRLLDESEFLSPFGLRSLSRAHLDEPYVFSLGRDVYRVDYEPAESSTGMFGGNSNWRGPIWFPVNLLMFRALLHLYSFYGDDFTVECPTGSGRRMTLFEVAIDLCDRLAAIFRRDAAGRRPVFGGTTLFQTDPHWRDYPWFYEYFHGDNGAGLGASHQTGWTGLVAFVLQAKGALTREAALASGFREAMARIVAPRESRT